MCRELEPSRSLRSVSWWVGGSESRAGSNFRGLVGSPCPAITSRLPGHKS